MIFASFHQGKEENTFAFSFIRLFENHIMCVLLCIKTKKKNYLCISFVIVKLRSRRYKKAVIPE